MYFGSVCISARCEHNIIIFLLLTVHTDHLAQVQLISARKIQFIPGINSSNEVMRSWRQPFGKGLCTAVPKCRPRTTSTSAGTSGGRLAMTHSANQISVHSTCRKSLLKS